MIKQIGIEEFENRCKIFGEILVEDGDDKYIRSWIKNIGNKKIILMRDCYPSYFSMRNDKHSQLFGIEFACISKMYNEYIILEKNIENKLFEKYVY
jgi:hypothetical protein